MAGPAQRSQPGAPDLRGADARQREPAGVRRERERTHAPGIVEPVDLAAVVEVPDPDTAVAAGCGGAASRRGERRGARAAVLEADDLALALDVPHAGGARRRAAGQRGAGGVEADRQHRAGTSDPGQDPSVAEVVEGRGPALADRRKTASLRIEAKLEHRAVEGDAALLARLSDVDDPY